MTTEEKNSQYAIVKKCSCRNDGQDALHGKGNRVFNPFKSKDGKSTLYRCTVCGKEV